MESTSEMETALQFYEAARDNLSLVRVYCYCGNLEKVSFYRLSVQSPMSCVFLIHSEDKWRSKYFMLVWLGLEFFQPSDTGQLARVYLCFLASTSQEKSFLATKLSRPPMWLGAYHSLICNVNFRRQKSATTLATEQLHIILPVNLRTRLV